MVYCRGAVHGSVTATATEEVDFAMFRPEEICRHVRSARSSGAGK